MKYRKFSNICFNIPYSNSAIPNSTNLSIEMNNLTHNILHKGWCGEVVGTASVGVPRCDPFTPGTQHTAISAGGA